MAQFDILKVGFPISQSTEDVSELFVVIDNQQAMQLSDEPEHQPLPDDIEVISETESPTQDFWVHADNHHLVITLESGSEVNPLKISETGYFNRGDNTKYVDIIVAEKEGDDKKKTRKIRRRVVLVSY